jgi:hypothetical protein
MGKYINVGDYLVSKNDEFGRIEIHVYKKIANTPSQELYLAKDKIGNKYILKVCDGLKLIFSIGLYSNGIYATKSTRIFSSDFHDYHFDKINLAVCSLLFLFPFIAIFIQTLVLKYF